ncbi:MAG: hypothetical protein IPK72_06525 [Candidatus Eisenbacteria bacterium]|nr:hypothetical protein [Candidatus Eisenbacteria bacterium]
MALGGLWFALLLGLAGELRAESPDRAPAGQLSPIDADSLTTAPDSLAAPVDSLAPPAPRYRALLPAFTPSPTGALHRGAFDLAPDGTLREVLARPLGLSRAAGGSYHLPDALDWGDLPGREPLTLTADGLPLSKPNQPEMPPDLIAPVWIREASLAPVDPVDAPNLAHGGDRLAFTLERPDSTAAISGTRLTSGANASHTEEFYLLRPAGRSLLRVFYGDHKTIGRLLYLDELGENLRLDWERDLSVGRWGVGWHRSQARQKLIDERRWVFERTGFDAGFDRQIGGWEISSRGALDWGHLAWEGDEHQAKRKDAVAQALIRLTGPPLFAGTSDSTGQASGLLPVLSVQIDRDHLRFFAPATLSLDEEQIGLGFAAGLRGGTKTWRMRISAGRAEPVDGRAGLTGLAELERAGSLLRSRISVRQGVRPRVLPRYGNHLSTQVNQPFLSPVVDRDTPLERVRPRRPQWPVGRDHVGSSCVSVGWRSPMPSRPRGGC